MADFILGRLKFKWKGDWVTSTAYIIDDIVKYGANTYVCVINHTSGTFYTDLDSSAYWSLHTESFAYNSSSTAWASGTAYKNNDVVRWGANLFICNAHHTSAADWATNSAKFTLFVPVAYWRTRGHTATEKPLILNEHREFCEILKLLPKTNFEIGYHGLLHGIPGISNNDEFQNLNYEQAKQTKPDYQRKERTYGFENEDQEKYFLKGIEAVSFIYNFNYELTTHKKD